MINAYFNTLQNNQTFTINFGHKGLYLVAYRIFSTSGTISDGTNLSSFGNTWFAYAPAEVNTSTRYRPLSDLLRATTPNDNKPMYTALSDVRGITANWVSDNTLDDPEDAPAPIFSDYAGDLYIVVKVQTRNPGTPFNYLVDASDTVDAVLKINGVNVTPSSFYMPLAYSDHAQYRTGSDIGSGSFSTFANDNVREMGAENVAQILFKFPRFSDQTQNMVDDFNQITLDITI